MSTTTGISLRIRISRSDLHPVDARQRQVEHDRVGSLRGGGPQALLARLGLDHLEAAGPERRAEGPAQRRVVLDDEQARHAVAPSSTGRVIGDGRAAAGSLADVDRPALGLDERLGDREPDAGPGHGVGRLDPDELVEHLRPGPSAGIPGPWSTIAMRTPPPSRRPRTSIRLCGA